MIAVYRSQVHSSQDISVRFRLPQSHQKDYTAKVASTQLLKRTEIRNVCMKSEIH